MNILITGAKGFVGKNLTAQLNNIRCGLKRNSPVGSDLELFLYDIDTPEELLDEYCKKADFVFNLAGVNRPKTEDEFLKGNFGFGERLLNTLKKYNNTCPVMLSSSTQAALDNPYGRSKKAGEELFFEYSKKTGANVLVYRFPNIFGKWCRPNYNSAVATFCNNIANDLPITVNDRSTKLNLVYIDDVVDELISALAGAEHRDGDYCVVPTVHLKTLGEIVDLLYRFNDYKNNLMMPEASDTFVKKLYATYLSYLPKEKVSFDLKMNTDDRGSFTELMHTENSGQFSVNISKPGITKGQHWHNTKWEFFIVVSGEGLIQQRRIDSDEVLEFYVSGDNIKAVHMLPGYTHNIINLSEDKDLITIMWANENFDSNNPDTYYQEV